MVETTISCSELPNWSARQARMRRCLILRQGASPLKPPAPFPSFSMLQKRGNLSRVRKPRPGPPLTSFLSSDEHSCHEGKGASCGHHPLASLWSASSLLFPANPETHASGSLTAEGAFIYGAGFSLRGALAPLPRRINHFRRGFLESLARSRPHANSCN
jgi:hypothetical protein